VGKQLRDQWVSVIDWFASSFGAGVGVLAVILIERILTLFAE
jgi:hypothetical protein